MGRRKDPEGFIKRAQQKGSEKNKKYINGKKVQKKVNDQTKKARKRQVANFLQFVKGKFNAGTNNDFEPPREFVLRLANDLETLKDFMQTTAFDIDGLEAHDADKEIDLHGALSTVNQYWKDFVGGWKVDNDPIAPELITQIRLFLKEELPEILEMRVSKRPRRYADRTHFFHYGRQMWAMDWYIYETPKTRVSDWADFLVMVCSSSRIGEYIESSARQNSGRGLYYKDITFGAFRNEFGNVEFAVKVIRDAKNTTRPDKRPEHSFYEGFKPLPLFCQPMLFILAILVAKGAFRDYKTIEELFNIIPPNGEMRHLQWDRNVVRQPFFESISAPGEIESATAFGGRFRELGFRAGYAWPGTMHDFRALGLYLIHHLYPQVSMEKYAGQKGSNTFRDHYLPNLTGDGQGSYFGTGTRSLVNDLFLSLTLPRNSKLAQELPAEKQHEVENSQEYIDLDEQISGIIGKKDPDSVKDRKELYEKRRKLLLRELRKWQKLQPNKLEPGEMDNPALEGHHRTIFSRTRFLMPERDRLASSLLEVAPLRSAIGLAALRDLVALYQKETEIEVRPGLEPEKCSCSTTKAAHDWKHIYDCFKKGRIAKHGFAELCFLCHDWIFAKSEWEDHCQAHLNNPETLPIQCNPLVHGGVLATSGYCGFCLNDTSLPAAERMKQLPLRNKWKEHINKCFNEHVQDWDGQPLHCPYSCKGAFDSPRRLQFHLQDVHCYQFIKERKGLKRSRQDDEMDTKPVRAKRQRSGYTRERGVGSAAPVKLEYDFIYETVEVKGPRSRCDTSTPPSTSATSPSSDSARSSISPGDSDWADIDALTSSGTPASSVCSDILERIDPQLRCPPVALSITGTKALGYEAIDVVDLTSPDEGHSHLSAQRGSAQDAQSSQKDPIHTQDADLSDPSSKIPSRQDIGGAIREAPDQEYLVACKGTIQKPEPPAVVLENDEFIVERILSHKVDRPEGWKKRIPQYLVKWEGYPDNKNSWVHDIGEEPVKAYTATAEQILKKRRVRLGRRKKLVTQYLVRWGGYPDDQKIWLNEDRTHENLIEAYRSAATTA